MNRVQLLAGFAGSAIFTARAARPVRAALPSPGLPAVVAGPSWVGTRPTLGDLAGRVVLVDVFTFECINCTRVVPNLKRLRARYAPGDLAIVAVHAPEVPSYQSSARYVEREARMQSIEWPIVLDNDYRVWNAFGIDAWPTQLVFDRRGTLRYRLVGDSQDASLDAAIARLVAG